MASIIYGFLILFFGFSVMLLTYFLTRVSQSQVKEPDSNIFPGTSADIQASDDAVLIVGAGGRVIYFNEITKKWFGITSNTPNLERLIHKSQPSEVFLELCAREGQARFSIAGRLVEGISYQIPSPVPRNHNGHDLVNRSMLVSLRRLNLTVSNPADNAPQEALSVFASLSEKMVANLELAPTIQTILESVEKLIPNDWSEITLWDVDDQTLAPYRLIGAPGYNRHLEKQKDRYSIDRGYSGYLASHRKPLVIGNVDEFKEIHPVVSRNQYPFSSYLGIPLAIDGDFIGTLELTSQEVNRFTENDLYVVRLLASTAAVALRNASQYEAEKKRVLELSGLTNLSKAMNNLADIQDLFNKLVDGITELVPVKVLGFLLYRENHHILEAQPPFRGIPDQLINLYRVEIPPGSQVEEILHNQKRILATDAANDETLKIMGLDGMAVASGIQNTILVPLKTPMRILGYMQAADRLDGFQFDQADLRLFDIIAVQSAAMIENATLVKESQSRAQRSETLRRVASLAGSSATLDEIMTHSLRELVRLLRADVGLLLLLDEYIGDLYLHPASMMTSGESPKIAFNRINMAEERFKETVTASMEPVFQVEVNGEDQIPTFYRNIFEDFDVQSMLAVPFIVRGQGVGELILTSHETNHFDQNDLTLVSTTANQLSVAIEKAALYGQTDESLRRRVVQLLALNRVSRELSTTLELKRLLQVVYDQLIQTTEADCGAIFLFEQVENAFHNPKVSFHVGDSVGGSLTPIEHKVLMAGEPYIVRDYLSPDPNAPDTMPIPPHPKVRSSLIVPIAYQNKVAGLIHIHSQIPDRFDSTSQEIVQSLAVQAAIAIGNAQRYQEQQSRNELLNRRVETLTVLLETTKLLRATQPLIESLETIAYGIQSATPFDIVLISLYNSRTGCLESKIGVGIPVDRFVEMQTRTPSWQSVQNLLGAEILHGRSFFITESKDFIFPKKIEDESLDVYKSLTPIEDALSWQNEDQFLIPLISSDGEPLGLISVDSPRNHLRPDRPAVDSLEIFANQASLIIEAYEKITQLADRSEKLQAEVEQNWTTLENTKRLLEDLSEKEKAQVVSLNSANQRLLRLQACLEIADKVDQQQDRNGVLLALASQIQESMAMDYVLIGEIGETGPRLLYSIGDLPPGAAPQALLGQRNPLRTSLQTSKAIYAPDINTLDEWKNSPLLILFECRSFICQPILNELPAAQNLDSDLRVNAAILIMSREPISYFGATDEEALTLVARQATIALQNLRVIADANRRLQEMNLLLEFSRQLGTLDSVNILETLVEGVLKVIPAAHAGMAALWTPETELLKPVVASGYPDNEKILQIPYRVGESLPGKAFLEGNALRQAEVLFAQDYNLQQEHLLLYRDATQGQLPVSAMAVPLQSFDAKLGVLVLDNFREPDAFNEDDQALVTALARQTALTLQNVNLYQATQARTAQLQTLTQVAGTITSSLKTDDLIRSLLHQVESIVPFDTGTLWLRHGDQVEIHAAAGFEDREQREGLSVALKESLLLQEMSTSNQPLSVSDVRNDERFTSLIEHQYLSWLGVPLLSKGEMVGVIVLEKEEAGFYTSEHIQMMVTFTGQAAVALENAKLYEESLSRAKDLDERTQRLSLLNQLSSELSGSLNLDNIFSALAREMLRAIGGSFVSVALLNEEKRAEVLIREPVNDETLPILLPESLVLERLQESLGVFRTDDISQEPDIGSLSDYLTANGTISLLIVPLISGRIVIGMTFIHAGESIRFSPDEVALAITINNQAAVAIQNARLFQETERLITETQQRSTELAALFDLGVQFTQILDQNRLLDISFENVNQLIHPDAIVVALIDTENQLKAHIFEGGERLDPITIERRSSSLSEHVIESTKPLLLSDTHDGDNPAPGIVAGEPSRCWLGVPLVVRGVTKGAISIQSNQPNVFSESHLQLLSQIANQLSVALDNAQLFHTVQVYTEELEQRVNERTAQVDREHRRIQTLLSITTELSASLDLDLVLSRTLGVVNETVESEHATVLLIQADSPYLYLRASQGYTGNFPQSGIEAKLKRDEGLAGWVIHNRQSVLIEDLHEDDRWLQHPDRTSLHRSAMIVPLMVGEEILGVMMVFHRSPSMFNSDQLDLIQAVAKQIAIAVNNAQLYGLIRDQAERLGDMLRTQHIETSRSQAILEAVADGVLVTDARRQITLFNASAENILGLSRVDILGKSLEQFIGLFGRAAQAWVRTIHTWSENPETYEVGDSYEEQIELENRRVVSVHLSPVHLRSDFLGTVSIFRDITHQVEVDRLKSEFVATVSHELRTPMTSIKGYVEILLMGAAGQITPQQAHFLEIVKGNTERLAILVNDLLDVSRIEAGKVILSMQPIDLRFVVNEILDQLERRMVEENRTLIVDKNIPDNLPLIRGDPERIRQIFDNLIENAYQYTPVGGKVVVAMRQLDHTIQIEISDNGIGIKPEEQARIFERFYRGEDPLVLSSSGTGLGLSIVKRLVEMHHGKIWFESEGIPGRGSVFSFTLPAFNEDYEQVLQNVDPNEDDSTIDKENWVLK
jgi:PAS domain S-box-containing protein